MIPNIYIYNYILTYRKIDIFMENMKIYSKDINSLNNLYQTLYITFGSLKDESNF